MSYNILYVVGHLYSNLAILLRIKVCHCDGEEIKGLPDVIVMGRPLNRIHMQT